MQGIRCFLSIFAVSCLSHPALADPTPVEVVVPDYEITFSKLPDKIDILGLRPGMDEATATQILSGAGYRFKHKDNGDDCTYPETRFERFKVCITKDDGTRYFISDNPMEDVFLKFAPVQAGGRLLEITRLIDYRDAASSADIPKPEDVEKALRAKYPVPTAGEAYNMKKIQCWAYHDGQPVAKFGWSADWCGTSEKVPVDVRLTFSNTFRLEANLSDLRATDEAYSTYRAYVKAASDKIIQDSLSKTATAPKL